MIIVGPILTKFGRIGNPLGITSKTWPRLTCHGNETYNRNLKLCPEIYIYM